MRGYYCRQCERVLAADELDVDVVVRDDGSTVGELCRVKLCAYCESSDIESTELCDRCGREPPLDGDDLCEHCAPQAWWLLPAAAVVIALWIGVLWYTIHFVRWLLS